MPFEVSSALIVGLIIAIAVIILFCIGYVKAPPDMAYIISGLRKKPRYVMGKASVKVPFFERLDKVSLKLIPIDVKTSNAVPTADYININVDATVNIKISNQPEKLHLAAENFLNKNSDYIASVAREVLEGNVREIVGKMRLEEMVSDRQKFANLVKENAEPDLAAMGLDIISFNVQNFVDGNDVIENLGIDNIVKIKKAAAIARAESERDIKVAQAAADKESNDAAVAAQTEIAKKQNELDIKKSELQRDADTKRAMADAAYEIQKEEQRKVIEITTANANIAKQEREIELKQKEVAVREQALDAQVKKQAEAERYAAQQRADAELYQRQKDAEARKFEAERAAEARKAQAEADKYAKEQEAAGIRAVGEAEAKAIEAKGIAEAEAMEKKAEAYAKYNKAAVAEMLIKVLPDIAGKIAEPLSAIDKVTIIGGGESSNGGVNSVAGNVPVVMAKVFESMKETTGIDLAEIVKADTYDAKVNRNVNLTGLEGVTVNVDDSKKVTETIVKTIVATEPEEKASNVEDDIDTEDMDD
ncbi:MAG: flotillin family protein [Clostridia bacterium]|nr:flotillin family protein [Clostridia bacterium]